MKNEPPFYIAIPARYASTRLPGKPLLALAGRPMIQRVYERASASGAQAVVVATDDERIAQACRTFGADVCMTSPACQSGTDRIAEVIARLDWPDDALVVNLQGDEPLMPPALLSQVALGLSDHPDAAVATLATPLTEAWQIHDENVVKVVCDHRGMALYFSRAPIPWKRGRFDRQAGVDTQPAAGMFRHIGLYAYRAGFVREYVKWPVAPIERDEALEQLRVLWNGHRIFVSVAHDPPPAGVDTENDLKRVDQVMRGALTRLETPP